LLAIGLGFAANALTCGYFAWTRGVGPCSGAFVVLLGALHGVSAGAAVAALRARGLVLLALVSLAASLWMTGWLLANGMSLLCWPYAR
jgi:hypothetical protein